MALTLATPGVYNVELSAFGNSVVPVATAIPAFIGYTARADYNGKSYLNTPVAISSLSDFLTFFGVMDPGVNGAPPTQGAPSEQNNAIYHLSKSAGQGDITVGGVNYDVMPDPGTIYYLYNSIRLFYQNGGANAYVVSVGFFGNPTGKAKAAADPLVNPNVKLSDLQGGLAAINDQPEPTMLVIPDANLLKAADNQNLMQNMLTQAGTLTSRVAILDVQAGLDPDPQLWPNDITAFRTAVGMNALNYGVAYYPWLQTTVTQSSDIDFTNAGGAAELQKILPEAASDPTLTILNNILKPPATNAPTAAQSDASLQIASPSYASIAAVVLEKINTLPPAAAMAGVYTAVDNAQGVWKAPGNVSLTAVTDTTLRITDATQAGLNVDAITGKSINAIRLFTGKGVLVWGARTLDGNSGDWRYISVRRTMIMIEQSIKTAAYNYVFEPNDANTWSTVQSEISNFLNGIWSQGGLQGASPADAFSVTVGLGTTMTSLDIINGRMNITVLVAVTHPAEFIVITYSQQQAKS